MISKLQITNFQSHRDTTLRFGNGVNVILGVSQHGKTAILRALRLLTDNRPMGASYYSDFAPDKGITDVTLILDDGTEVGITKEIKRNGTEKSVVESAYSVNNLEFAGNRDQVPDQVKAALNMTSLNVQRQFDAPFLIASTPGEIARTINRITKLEDVDGWVADLTSEINQANRDVARLTEEVRKEAETSKKYDDIPVTEVVVKELMVLDTECISLRNSLLVLMQLSNDLNQSNHDVEYLQEIMVADRYVAKAERLQKAIDDAELLANMLSGCDVLQEVIEGHTLALRDLEAIDAELGKTEIDYATISCLDSIIALLDSAETDVAKSSKELDTIKDKYAGWLGKEGICPTCFSAMTPSQLQAIKEHL